MIGPLFHSPHRAPRRTPLPLTAARRAKNVVTDVAESLLAPFARWKHQCLIVEEVVVAIRDLPAAFDGYRIAFITDLHSSRVVPRWWIQRALARAMELRGDLVALGGDFVDDDADYVPGLADLLRPLRAPDGVVAVLGNHDHYVNAMGVREQLRLAGVRELLNAPLVLERGAAQLAVSGVGDLQCDAIDFTAAFSGVPSSVPRIVLSHDPDVFAYWPAEVRLDLMLSGHTHGGQAYLPVLGPPFVPSQFGFRYLKGHFREAGRQLYVSRGVGAAGAPIRWKCPPELTLVVLRTGDA
jgi:predicted MPP superfamily phosphohydrolase